jgi:hypothetical protein
MNQRKCINHEQIRIWISILQQIWISNKLWHAVRYMKQMGNKSTRHKKIHAYRRKVARPKTRPACRILPPPRSREADDGAPADVGSWWPFTGSSRLKLQDENHHKDLLLSNLTILESPTTGSGRMECPLDDGGTYRGPCGGHDFVPRILIFFWLRNGFRWIHTNTIWNLYRNKKKRKRNKD